jgi:two-component system, NarL family, sensor histidine kinase UhpB
MWQDLQRTLLRIPLKYKILLANCAIVAAGAVAGTVITVWHVRQYPDDIHYELIVLFTAIGIVASFWVNSWVLKRALAPLDRLQNAVDAVRQGHTDVHVVPGATSDERFDRLAETFNQMLTRLEEDARQLQQLSRQILQAQEEERHRLARELHDEAAQALTLLLVRLRLLERAHTPDEAQQRVQELRELTAQALENVRRVALDLRPTILDDLGLGAALEWRVDEFNLEFSRGNGTRATFDVRGLEGRLPREVELIFYRIGQEALSNVARHAGATQVCVGLQRAGGQLTLEVLDDGRGFDLQQVRNRAHTGGHVGLGLLGMRERLGMIGGELLIDTAPGQGTRIIARTPVP